MFNFFQNSNEIKGPRNESLPLTHDGLPDSYRPNGLCPRCGKQSSFEAVGSLPVTFSGGTIQKSDGLRYPAYSDRVTSFKCRHCNQCVVVVEEEWVGEQPSRLGIGRGGVTSFRGINWWPLPESRLSSDIPEIIASIFNEAATAYYANAPRASAIMLRCTLEAITEHFNETKGNLFERLETLSERGILQPTLYDWAKEVRLIGNQSAHNNPIQPVSQDDVKQLLDFERDLLKYLFELPAELQRRRTST